MADIETLDRSEHSSTAEGANAVQDQSLVQGSPAKSNDDGQPLLTKPDAPSLSSEPSPASPSAGAGQVPLRGPTPNGATPGSSTVPTLSVPHPKKFAHSNINKKFLEKTSSASGTGSTLATTAATKVGNSAQKPTVQTSATHSKLVTTKLTAGPQPSTLTGPGWSRPSSTGSTVAPTPPPSTNPKPSPLLTPASTSAAPVPIPAGKVIHPSLRPLDGPAKKDNGSKPVWGSTRAVGGSGADSVQNDFPTAAEVAQAKLNEKKQAAQAAAAQKQALAADADAFRGVHLGSGHHWDEDEGDDDNFLDEVIEFGDGRQYTIPTEPRQSSPPRDLPELSTDAEGESSTKQSETPPFADQPVSKEERFQDDFDRSWPRSRGSGPLPSREQFPHRPPSSASSQPLHSPQEGSRVLFNERSNRLEPYSRDSHRFPGREAEPHRFPGRESFPSRRDSRSDHTISPVESRNGRDLPPHSARGVQLLQKPHDAPPDRSERSRVFGDRPGPGFRDKDMGRRDLPPHALKQPLSATDSRSRDHYNPLGLPHLSPVDARNNNERARRLSTGPDALPPPSSADSVRPGGRAVPPHLPALNVPPAQRGPPSVTSPGGAPGGPSSAHLAQSPAASFASLSPRMADSPLQSASTMPLVDLDEVRKQAMHSAAERAKLRRQQEEEEREKERERARRKAAELEAKMKEAEGKVAKEKADKEQAEAEANAKAEEANRPATEAQLQVLEVIESAVQSVAPGPSSATAQASTPISATQPKTPFVRSPSTRGGIRPTLRRPSFPASSPVVALVSPATENDSWRTTAGPPKPLQRPTRPEKSPVISTVQPPPVVFEAVQDLTIQADEEVEIVDFSELGKLVGKDVAESPSVEVAPVALSPFARPLRPVATDFFEDSATSTEESTWRRKLPVVESAPATQPSEHTLTAPPIPTEPQSAPPTQPHAPSHHRRMSTASDDHSRSYGPHGHPRSPVAPSYREAPMSALDDTMARIRGAMNLTSIQHKPAEQQGPSPVAAKPPAKWLPPALRPRPATMLDDAPEEVFDVTAVEPPRSPKPAWNHYAAKLPTISHPVGTLSKKQLHMAMTVPHVRSDVFSWDPPIDGMNRKDFHLNDILFPKLYVQKGGRPKYHVSIPRLRVFARPGRGPVVNLPNRPVGGAPMPNSAFGKPREADEATSWRKPAVKPSPLIEVLEGQTLQGLDTTSRSPPPETLSIAVTAPAAPKTDDAASAIGVVPAKSRSQHKMPHGSDGVAFSRALRSDSVSAPGSTVKFIVSSELEESSVTTAVPLTNGVLSQPEVRVNGDLSPPATSRVVKTDAVSVVAQVTPVQTVIDLKPESKKTDVSSDATASAPLPPWSAKSSPRVFSLKDSPSRPPDRDHLKAVWETTSNKADGTVNSLERIADDMPAVPLSIFDVKSEDGETPPPTTSSNPPSRMSQHDVTRAFQQVPTSAHSNLVPHGPASASHTSITSPPTRPLNHAMPPPPHPGASVRPMYPGHGYPSPLLGSPSPTVVYPMSMTPSPIPRPMVVNGGPQYPQPMWVPIPGPPTSQPNGMMRPGPPYGPQLMPYPPPGGMYPPPHNMQGNVPQAPNGMQNRPPNGMPLLSPVMAHAHAHPHPHNGPPHPVYAQSPVLMHASAPGHPGHAYPGPNHSQHQPPRGRGAYDPSHAHAHPHAHPPAPGMMPYTPGGSHPPHQAAPTYTAVPSNASFDRPHW